MNDYVKIELVRLASDGTNWVSYRDRLIVTLKSRRWHDHLISDTVTTTYTSRGDINNLTPAMRWEDNDEAVKHLIMSSVPDDIFNRIKTGTNAKEWWEKLKGICEGRSRSILIDLGRRLQNTHCGEDDNVRAHFARLADIREQLAAMGESVADQQYANILLASLPSCYEMRICAITTNADETGKTIDPTRIVKLISDDYDKRMINKSNGKEADDQAFASTTQKSNDKRNIECYNCKKKGHIKADCWAMGGGKEGQGPERRKRKSQDQSKDSAAAATDKQEDIESWAAIVAEENPQGWDEASSSYVDVEQDSSDEELCEALSEDYDLQVSATSAQNDDEAELYDSGASRHITPNRHRFITYRPITPRAITAANQRVFYAVGVGDVRIQVPNGVSSTPVVLRDVLHAPDIGATVVSIGRVTKAGYSVLFEGERCKIMTKNKATIGDIQVSANNIYKVLHARAATLDSEQVNIAMLHRRLGHTLISTIRTPAPATPAAQSAAVPQTSVAPQPYVAPATPSPSSTYATTIVTSSNQSPAITDSGEEEKPEDEPASSESPAMPAALGDPKKVKPAEETQATRKSTRVPKPSDSQKRIARGEGTSDGMHPDFEGEIANVCAEQDDTYCARSLEEIWLAEEVPGVDQRAEEVPEEDSRAKEVPGENLGAEEDAASMRTPNPLTYFAPSVNSKAKDEPEVYSQACRMAQEERGHGPQDHSARTSQDYHSDTLSPAPKPASFRTTHAFAACHDHIISFDFSGACLKLSEDEEASMHQAPGYESQGEETVLKLVKSPYGLKLAGRKWYDTFSHTPTDLGICATHADQDDCAFTGRSRKLITKYKDKTNNRYSLTNLWPIQWLLSIKAFILKRFAFDEAKAQDISTKRLPRWKVLLHKLALRLRRSHA